MGVTTRNIGTDSDSKAFETSSVSLELKLAAAAFNPSSIQILTPQEFEAIGKPCCQAHDQLCLKLCLLLHT